MGLIFLKYISDAFEKLDTKLKAEEEQGADPEDKDEYNAENVFFVPKDARWSFLLSQAKQPEIGKLVDEAMDAIEKTKCIAERGIAKSIRSSESGSNEFGRID